MYIGISLSEVVILHVTANYKVFHQLYCEWHIEYPIFDLIW